MFSTVFYHLSYCSIIYSLQLCCLLKWQTVFITPFLLFVWNRSSNKRKSDLFSCMWTWILTIFIDSFSIGTIRTAKIYEFNCFVIRNQWIGTNMVQIRNEWALQRTCGHVLIHNFFLIKFYVSNRLNSLW